MICTDRLRRSKLTCSPILPVGLRRPVEGDGGELGALRVTLPAPRGRGVHIGFEVCWTVGSDAVQVSAVKKPVLKRQEKGTDCHPHPNPQARKPY